MQAVTYYILWKDLQKKRVRIPDLTPIMDFIEEVTAKDKAKEQIRKVGKKNESTQSRSSEGESKT